MPVAGTEYEAVAPLTTVFAALSVRVTEPFSTPGPVIVAAANVGATCATFTSTVCVVVPPAPTAVTVKLSDPI